MPEFYILSVKWTRATDPWVTFWRPKNAGYAWPLEWAGRYTEEQIRALPDYYDNITDTLAVPCDAVEAQAVPAYIDRKTVRAVPRERERIRALRRAASRARVARRASEAAHA